MMHTCAVAENGCKDTANSRCRRGFNGDIVETTYIDEKGYPVYRKRTQDDAFVVSYNEDLLSDWEGHINVEFCGSSKCIFYLYKYLFKGRKNVPVTIVDNDDEIDLYLKARFLTSFDAVWRILGYHTYPATLPGVRYVTIKTESQANDLLSKNKSCDMGVYMCRPEQLYGKRYNEVFKEYSVQISRPTGKIENIDYFTVRMVHPVYRNNVIRYIVKRVKRVGNVSRIGYVPLIAGEIWYLRQIILHSAPINWIDARSHNGVIYDTYQEAAIAKGYVKEHEEAIAVYNEAKDNSTPNELRGIFGTMMTQGFPIVPIYQDENLREFMLEDYIIGQHNPPQNHAQANNSLLKDLQRRISDTNYTLAQFGLPNPVSMETELDREKLLYVNDEQRTLYDDLNREFPNNRDQQHVFDNIKTLIDNPPENHPSFFFINGAGGTGKTTVLKKIAAYARSQGKIVLICASITLAAILYVNGVTAHSLFKFPVTEEFERALDEEIQQLHLSNQRLELLLEVDIIIWDEFVTNHKELFETVYKTICLGYNSSREANKNLIFCCGGDFRQILPVIEGGGYYETTTATISSSSLWEKFRRLQLNDNMRLTKLRTTLPDDATQDERYDVQHQLNYAQCIVSIGNGTPSENCIHVEENAEEHSITLCLPLFDKYFHSDVDEGKLSAIRWLYPTGFCPQRAAEVSILATTNDSVEKWNSIIQDMNTSSDVVHLFSKDIFTEADDPYGKLQRMLTTANLNRMNKNGIPPHTLSLKLNDICIILRPIMAQGIPTNARVRISKISPYCIEGNIIGGTMNGRKVHIPRMRFKFRCKYGMSFEILRTQFPIRLAYSITINKSQSQTLKTVLIDLQEDCFSHGQLYVAASRITDANNVKLYLPSTKLREMPNGQIVPLVKNIVYKSILENTIYR